MIKLIISLMFVITAFFTPVYSYAEAAPKLNLHQIKNINVGKDVVKADVIFKTAKNDAYYAVKSKSTSMRLLKGVARKRVLCGTALSFVACEVAKGLARRYFADEIGFNNFDYDAATNTFKREIPNRYSIGFGSPSLGYYSSAGEFLSVYGQGASLTQYQLSSLNDKVSNIDFENPHTWVGIGVWFDAPNNVTGSDRLSVRVNDAALEGVAYNPDGSPVQQNQTLTEPQINELLSTALEDAPSSVIADLMGSTNFTAEGHEPLLEAAAEAKPYDITTDEYIVTDPDPDPDDGTVTDPDPDVNPDPDANPNPFSLPAFCSWATKLCDFVDWATEDPSVPDVDETLPTIHDIDDFDNTDIDKSYINSSGQCPAAESVDIGFGRIEISYTPLCTILEKLSGILVACAYLSGAYMIVRSV